MGEALGAEGRTRRAGFAGLGVMGFPICRHLHEKQAAAGLERVIATDVSPETLGRARALGIETLGSLADLVAESDILHLCLPGGPELEQVCRGTDGLLATVRAGQIIVDHTTAPVPLTRELAAEFAGKDVTFVDAPIARTRAAAESGTLVITFGGRADVLEDLRPALSCFASDIVHCGDVGAGQTVKQLNNMVLFQTVTALSEALLTAEAAGVSGETLFSALMHGSGDSFALRNHGMKALLPREFPERAFPAAYARKDIAYAIELAEAHGLELRQAPVTAGLFDEAIAAGRGDAYYPVIIEQIAAPRTEPRDV